VAGGIDAAQRGKSTEVHIFEKGSVGHQESGTGVFQLIADLAFAIRGIEQRGDASGERGCMVGDGEFPRVGEEDRDHLSGNQPSRDKAAGQGFDEAAIFAESEPATTGHVNQRCLVGVALAALEDNIVDEAARGIGVKLGAKHRG